jgi:hypothetical protein
MKLVVDKESLVSVADAIRTKGNTTDDLQFPNGFVDGINAIESGDGGNWYDFTIEITSDISTTQDLLLALSPYMQSLQPMKDVAIFSMQNVIKQPVSSAGVPLAGYINKKANGDFEGGATRYRSTTNLSTPISLASNSGVSVVAGDVFYVKVVNVLA